jgi:hypothetical protein
MNPMLAMMYSNPAVVKTAGKQRLNQSLIEYSKKPIEGVNKSNIPGHKHNTSFAPQMLADVRGIPVPKRPKSSQSFLGKRNPTKRRAANIRALAKEGQRRIHNGSHISQLLGEGQLEKLNKSLCQYGVPATSNEKMILSAYQPKAKTLVIEPPKAGNAKRAFRPPKPLVAQVPPSKAFPKELALINNFIISEKHKLGEPKGRSLEVASIGRRQPTPEPTNPTTYQASLGEVRLNRNLL